MSLQAAIAVTRFGLGARPGEIARVSADPRGWLRRQIRLQGADQPQGELRSTAQLLDAYDDFRQMRQGAKAMGAVSDEVAAENKARRKALLADLRDDGQLTDIHARARLAATTDAGFRERWTLFWCNHFAVSGAKRAVGLLVGPFEREAIRPHVFGRFEDMLVASTRHPAMLNYLNQAASVGPNSPAGGQAGKGLNENLAREILELHTVGTDGGYTQVDVTEFARALTGWSVPVNPADFTADGFLYRPNAHEPGRRTVMGKAYPDAGEGQARAVLRDLAANPATGRHLARKIAAHFVADAPPQSLVDQLASAYARSGGRLDAMAEALIAAPEAWAPQQAKLKTPHDFVVSTWRALDLAPGLALQALTPMRNLGQHTFEPPSPKGWPEEAAGWAAPAELLKRIAFAEAAAEAPATAAALARGEDVLGPLLAAKTRTAIQRADDPVQAFAILFMAPEFQRR